MKTTSNSNQKTSTLSFKSTTGLQVTITITRRQGTFTEQVNADGDIFDIENYHDDYIATSQVEGFGKQSLFSIEEIQGKDVILAGYRNGRPMYVLVPQEIKEQFRALASEHIASELTEEEKEEVESAKEAIETGNHLPSAELREKIRKYNETFNDGGYGFNPFANYMTDEEIKNIKSKYPKEF